jgi:hypothetical protein
MNLGVRKFGGRYSAGIKEILETEDKPSLKSECYTIMGKYPEAANVVQQVYKVLCFLL